MDCVHAMPERTLNPAAPQGEEAGEGAGGAGGGEAGDDGEVGRPFDARVCVTSSKRTWYFCGPHSRCCVLVAPRRMMR